MVKLFALKSILMPFVSLIIINLYKFKSKLLTYIIYKQIYSIMKQNS